MRIDANKFGGLISGFTFIRWWKFFHHLSNLLARFRSTYAVVELFPRCLFLSPRVVK